jgi:hypothetical protein
MCSVGTNNTGLRLRINKSVPTNRAAYNGPLKAEGCSFSGKGDLMGATLRLDESTPALDPFRGAIGDRSETWSSTPHLGSTCTAHCIFSTAVDSSSASLRFPHQRAIKISSSSTDIVFPVRHQHVMTSIRLTRSAPRSPRLYPALEPVYDSMIEGSLASHSLCGVTLSAKQSISRVLRWPPHYRPRKCVASQIVSTLRAGPASLTPITL